MVREKAIGAFGDKHGQDWELRENGADVRIIPFVVLDPGSSEPTFGAVEAAVIVFAVEDAEVEDIAYALSTTRKRPLADALREDYEWNAEPAEAEQSEPS